MVGVLCFTKPYSATEKKEILTQFKELQKAVKEKNNTKIAKYVNFPLSVPTTYNEKLTKQEFFEDGYYLLYIDMLKVNINKMEITPVENYLLGHDEETGDYYIDVTAGFIDTKEELIPGFEGKGFVVTVSGEDDMYGGATYYVFVLENKKLKLAQMLIFP